MANHFKNSNSSPIYATDSLPEQRHAGKVGYGPNFTTSPTLGDKIVGLKEEIVGKLTRNSERVSHGHEILTGEEKRKKLTGEDEPSPFENAGGDGSKNGEEKPTGSQDRSSNTPFDQGASK